MKTYIFKKVNGDVDAIKECKAWDRLHPACYIVN